MQGGTGEAFQVSGIISSTWRARAKRLVDRCACEKPWSNCGIPKWGRSESKIAPAPPLNCWAGAIPLLQSHFDRQASDWGGREGRGCCWTWWRSTRRACRRGRRRGARPRRRRAGPARRPSWTAPRGAWRSAPVGSPCPRSAAAPRARAAPSSSVPAPSGCGAMPVPMRREP